MAIDYDIPEWKIRYLSERKQGEYVMPAPNEFVWSLRDVVFGRREYGDEEPGLWPLHRRPSNWRDLVGDKYADMPIASDIDRVGTFLPFSEVYDACKVEQMLVQHPTVIQHVHALSSTGFRTSEFKPLKIALGGLFRSQYHPVFMDQWKDRCEEFQRVQDERKLYCPSCEVLPTPDWITNGPERYWKQACKQFDLATDLIARFLCRHLTIYPDEWVPLVAQHVDLSQYYKHFTSKSLATKKRPEMIE